MADIIFDGSLTRDLLGHIAQRDRAEAAERQAERQYELDRERLNRLAEVYSAQADSYRASADGQRARTADFEAGAQSRRELEEEQAALARAQRRGAEATNRFNADTASDRARGIRAEANRGEALARQAEAVAGTAEIDLDEARTQQVQRHVTQAERLLRAGNFDEGMGVLAKAERAAGITGVDPNMPWHMRFAGVAEAAGASTNYATIAAEVQALNSAVHSAEASHQRSLAAIEGQDTQGLRLDNVEQRIIDESFYNLTRRAQEKHGSNLTPQQMREVFATDPELKAAAQEIVKNSPELARVLEGRPNVQSGNSGLDFVPLGNTGLDVPTVNSVNGSRAPITQGGGQFADGDESPAAAITGGDFYDILRLSSTQSGGSIGLIGAGVEGLLASIAPQGATVDDEQRRLAQQTLPNEGIRQRAAADAAFFGGAASGSPEMAGLALGEAPAGTQAAEEQRRAREIERADATASRAAREARRDPAAVESRREEFYTQRVDRAVDNLLVTLPDGAFEEEGAPWFGLASPRNTSYNRAIPGVQGGGTTPERNKYWIKKDVEATLADPENREIIAKIPAFRRYGTDVSEWDDDAAFQFTRALMVARMNDTSGSLFKDEDYTLGVLNTALTDAAISGASPRDQARQGNAFTQGMGRSLRGIIPQAAVVGDILSPGETEGAAPRERLDRRERLSIRNALR